ncbi:hypothetical protein [Methylomonas fluvii]|nr:hypothetical protein [Methylomonas fluvii]
MLGDWKIWLRRESRFKQSETAIETHPALSGDRRRQDELKAELGDLGWQLIQRIGHA